MAEVVNVEASVARLVELEEQMDSLEESYKSGKISIDAYNKSLSSLEAEADSLSKTLLKQGEDVDGLVSSYKSLNKVQGEGTKKVEEYEMSYDKVGSTANAALSIVASGLSKTNPMLATAISGVQKLIPNLVEVGNAARTAGSLVKGLASSAGIGLAIVALTSVVDIIAKLVAKHKEQEQAAEDAKNAEVTAAQAAKGAWLDYWDSIKDKIGSSSAAERELDTLNANIAAIEKRREEFAKHGAVLEKEYQDQLEAGYARRLQLEKQIQDERKKGSGGTSKSDILKQLEEDEKALEQALGDDVSPEDMADAYYAAIVRAAVGVDELAESEKKRKEYLDSIHSSVMSQGEAEAALMDEQIAKQKILAEEEKKAKELKLASYMAVGDAFANLTEGMADMYESDEANSKRNAKKIKNLRIATATIDMLNGAVKAYASAQDLPAPFGQIVGAANAAAMIAMGTANINKIKSTDMESGSVSSSSVQKATGTTQVYSVSSSVDADRITQAIQTGTSKAADSKVVLVVEDLNKVQNGMKKADVESSF